MGIVPRSISTIKEWREPSANWSPKTRSGTRPISCTTPWCESFTRSDNGLRVARVCSGQARTMVLNRCLAQCPGRSESGVGDRSRLCRCIPLTVRARYCSDGSYMLFNRDHE